MIDIYNMRYAKPVYPYEIRVDRQSILGNPYIMRDEGERDRVCRLYVKHFKSSMEHNESFAAEVNRLVEVYKHYGKLSLYCWCSPKRCHAETIRDYIMEVIANDK